MADTDFVLKARTLLGKPTNLNQFINQINNAIKSGVKTNFDINVNAKSVVSTTQAVNQLGRATQTASVASTRLNKALNSNVSSLEKLGKQAAVSIRRFGAFALVVSSFYKLTGAISSTIDEALEFQDTMVKISQVTGTAVKDLKFLEQEASKLATTLGASSKELINATEILAQAGYTADQTRKAMSLLAKVQLSGTFSKDMKENAEGLIAIQAQFGLAIDDLEKKFDSAAKVAKAYAVESEDIIAATKRAGGAFAAAGGSFEEFISLLTAVRSTTRESAESIATGFRTIFTRLQRPRTIEFFKTLGINLQDAEGQFIGAYKSIGLISKALENIKPTDPIFAKVTEELGGYRQISKSIPLIQQFSKSEDARRIAMNAAGEVEKDAIKRQQSLINSFTKLREELALLVRNFTNDEFVRTLIDTFIKGSTAAIRLADSLRQLLPLITAVSAYGLYNSAFPIAKGIKNELFPKITKKNSGGFIPGVGNTDTVPAMLTPGEFVIRKEAVRKIGLNNLKRMNVKGYKDGGLVGGVGNVRSGLALAGLSAYLINIKDASEEMKFFAEAIGNAGVYLAVFSALLERSNQKQQFKVTSDISSFADVNQKKLQDAFGLLEQFANAGSENKKLVSLLKEVKIGTVDKNLYGSAKGYYNNGKIAVNTDLSVEQIAATIIHELTHYQQDKGGKLKAVDPRKDPNGYMASDSEKGARNNEKKFLEFLKKNSSNNKSDSNSNIAFSYSDDDIMRIYAHRIQARIQGSERFSGLSNIASNEAKNAEFNKLQKEEYSLLNIVGNLRNKEYKLRKVADREANDPTVSKEFRKDTEEKLNRVVEDRTKAEQRLKEISEERRLVAMGLTTVEAEAINKFHMFANELDSVRKKIAKFEFKSWTRSKGAVQNNEKHIEKLLAREEELEREMEALAPIVDITASLGKRSTETSLIKYKEVDNAGKPVTSPPRREMTEDELAAQWVREQEYKQALEREERYREERPKHLDVLARNDEWNRRKKAEQEQKRQRGRNLDVALEESNMANNRKRIYSIYQAMRAKAKEEQEKEDELEVFYKKFFFDATDDELIDDPSTYSQPSTASSFNDPSLLPPVYKLFPRRVIPPGTKFPTLLEEEEERYKREVLDPISIINQFDREQERKQFYAQMINDEMGTSRNVGLSQSTLDMMNPDMREENKTKNRNRKKNRGLFRNLNLRRKAITRDLFDAGSNIYNSTSNLNRRIGSSSIGKLGSRFGIGALAIGSAAGGALQTMGRHRIAKGDSSGVAFSTAGGALSGAASGAGLGSMFGPLGIAIGGTVGAVYGFTSSLFDAKKELATFKFNDSIAPIKEGLAELANGLSTPASQLPILTDGLKAFENRINSATGDDLITARGEFDNLAPQIDQLFSTIANESNSFKDFETSVGDNLKSFSRLRNVNYDTLVRSYKDIIDRNKKAAEVQSKLNQALESTRNRILTINAFADAVKEAGEKVSNFGSIADSLLNGSIIDRSNNFDRLSINSVQQASQLDKFIGSNFSDELINALQIDKELPTVLNKIQHGGVQDIYDVLKESLPEGAASDNILNAVREMIGPTLEDDKFINDLRNDFTGTLETLRGKLTPLLDIYKDLSSQLHTHTQNFISSLDEIARREEEISARRGEIIGIRGQQERFQAGVENRRVDFSLLGNLEKLQLQNMTGFSNNSPQFLGGELERAIQKRDELTTRISNGEQDAGLIKELDEQKRTINSVTNALKYLGNAAERTALLQEKLSELQKSRENKTDFFSGYMLAGQQERMQTIRNISNANSVDARGFELLKPEDRKNVWELFERFKDESIFNGKTGRERQQELISQRASQSGLSAEIVKRLSGKPGSDEQALITAINKQYSESAMALDALNTAQTSNLNMINQTLTAGFTETIAAIRESYGNKMQEDADRQAQDIDNNLAAINEKIANFSKLSKYGITDQASFEAARGQLTQAASIQDINNREKELTERRNRVLDIIKNSNGNLGDKKNEILDELAGLDQSSIDKIKPLLANKQLIDAATEDIGGYGSGDYQVIDNSEKLSEQVKGIFSSSLQNTREQRDTIYRKMGRSNLNPQLMQGLTTNYSALSKDLGKFEDDFNINDVKRLRQEEEERKRALGFNSGGWVPGHGNGDTVPAMLTPGEFVIRKEAAQSIGYDQLHKMNAIGYASGGLVGQEKREARERAKRELFERKKEERERREDQNWVKINKNRHLRRYNNEYEQDKYKKEQYARIMREVLANKRNTLYNKDDYPGIERILEDNTEFKSAAFEERLRRGEAAAEARVNEAMSIYRRDRDAKKQIASFLENTSYAAERKAFDYRSKMANKSTIKSAFLGHTDGIKKFPQRREQKKSTPMKFNNGGAVPSTGSSMDSSFYQAIKDFSKVADDLVNSLNNFPSEINHSINGRVEVIINGADVLRNILPEVQDLIESKVKDGIRQFTRKNFPELGG